MKLFGRESLRRAHAETKAAYAEKANEQKLREVAARKTKLARVLFHETVAEMEYTHNGLDLRPVDDAKQRKRFIRSMELEGDFEIDRLWLRARGDKISGWMEYGLQHAHVTTGKANSYGSISEFRAQERAYALSADLPDSETFLWQCTTGASPIHFESEEHEFVRNIAGLFLPRVISELEKEGL